MQQYRFDKLTFLKDAERNLRVPHVNLAEEVHPRKALDDLFLPTLGDRMIVRLDFEFKRSLGNVFLPPVRVPAGLREDIIVCLAPAIEFVDGPK